MTQPKIEKSYENMTTKSLQSLEVIGQAALSTRDTLRNSYMVATEVAKRCIPGDIVECGVFSGSQCGAMANAILCAERDTTRKIHMLDSFTGIPAAGPEDHEFLAAGHPAGLSACALDTVRSNMQGWGVPDSMVEYWPGMFAQTVPALARSMWESGRRIAVLRLDGDLYESTKVCIEHLYPLVALGGWCIIDDMALIGCRKAVRDYMDMNNIWEPTYWQKGNR